MQYQIPEHYMTLDGPWQGQRINVLVPQGESTKGINVVVASDVIPPEMDFEDYLTEQRTAFQEQLTGYEQLSDSAALVDDRPVHILEFSWINEGLNLQQMIMAIPNGDQVVSLTATVPGIADESTRALLMSTMNQFRFSSNNNACSNNSKG